VFPLLESPLDDQFKRIVLAEFVAASLAFVDPSVVEACREAVTELPDVALVLNRRRGD
jgi:hypothetical protein